VSQAVRAFVAHPITFGAGVGVGNAVLAKLRGKPLTARGTLLTVAVLGVGETILAMDETPAARKGRTAAGVGILSALGVFIGLALFTEWKSDGRGGGRPVLITEDNGTRPMSRNTAPA